MVDHEIEFLLSLNGFGYRFGNGHRIKIAAKRIKPNKGRPAGIKYSLTLHDTKGNRIYGIDNARSVKQSLTFDHWHVYDTGHVRPYAYVGAAQLLKDFYDEVGRILNERGIK